MPRPIDKQLIPLIVELLEQGRSYREIADIAGVSRGTVANVARRNNMTNYDPRVEEAAQSNRERGLNRYERELEQAEHTIEQLYDLAIAEPPRELDPANPRKPIDRQALDDAERMSALTKRILQAERRRKQLEDKLLASDNAPQPERISPGDLSWLDELLRRDQPGPS